MAAIMKTIVPLTLCALGLSFLASAQTSDEAAGKTFENACGSCHDSASTVEQRHTRRDWAGIVSDMASRGGSTTEDQMRDIVGWLVRHYGAIRINELNAQALQDEIELAKADAETLVAYRDKHGKFDDFEALKKVGVDPAKLEAYKESITY